MEINGLDFLVMVEKEAILTNHIAKPSPSPLELEGIHSSEFISERSPIEVKTNSPVQLNQFDGFSARKSDEKTSGNKFSAQKKVVNIHKRVLPK